MKRGRDIESLQARCRRRVCEFGAVETLRQMVDGRFGAGVATPFQVVRDLLDGASDQLASAAAVFYPSASRRNEIWQQIVGFASNLTRPRLRTGRWMQVRWPQYQDSEGTSYERRRGRGEPIRRWQYALAPGRRAWPRDGGPVDGGRWLLKGWRRAVDNVAQGERHEACGTDCLYSKTCCYPEPLNLVPRTSGVSPRYSGGLLSRLK